MSPLIAGELGKTDNSNHMNGSNASGSAVVIKLPEKECTPAKEVGRSTSIG